MVPVAEWASDRNDIGGWPSFKQGKPCLVIELVCYNNGICISYNKWIEKEPRVKLRLLVYPIM
jgi:hypothetical protein